MIINLDTVAWESTLVSLPYIKRIWVVLIEMYKMYNLLGPMYLHNILRKQSNGTSTRSNPKGMSHVNLPSDLCSLLWCKTMERASLEDFKLEWSSLFLFDM